MKRIIIGFILTFCFLEIYGQNKNYLSVEMSGSVYHYFMQDDGYKMHNDFNYGAAFLLSEYIRKIKVSFGVNYATKKSYVNVQPDEWRDSLNKIGYDIRYLSLPIFVGINVYSFEKWKINCSAGISFNEITRCDVTTFHQHKASVTESFLINHTRKNISFHFGVGIAIPIFSNLNINCSPVVNYEKRDYDRSPGYKNMPESNFSFQLKLGIEYLFPLRNKAISE